VLDRMIVSGTKQLPVLLGRNEGATTTHATVQWQIYAAGIEALREHAGRMLEWLHNTALRVYGRASHAVVTFEPLRKSDREAEARAAKAETETLVTQVQAGWITNDEAAQKVAKHDAVGPMTIVARQPQGPTAAPLEPRGVRLALQPPEGVDWWLWDRARQTAQAVDQWAAQSFQKKLSAYLAPETEQPE